MPTWRDWRTRSLPTIATEGSFRRRVVDPILINDQPTVRTRCLAADSPQAAITFRTRRSINRLSIVLIEASFVDISQ